MYQTEKLFKFYTPVKRIFLPYSSARKNSSVHFAVMPNLSLRSGAMWYTMHN